MKSETIRVRNLSGKRQFHGAVEIEPGGEHDFPAGMVGSFNDQSSWEIVSGPERIMRAVRAGRVRHARNPGKINGIAAAASRVVHRSRLESSIGSTTGFPRVLMLADNKAHYSGGRYFFYQLAVALSEAGASVMFVTNARPIFEDDYADYDTSRISWLVTNNTAPLPEEMRNDVDVVLVAPIEHLVHGITMARMSRVPCYCVVFDLPNWLESMGLPPENLESRSKVVEQYRESLEVSDGIIAISRECAHYAASWSPGIEKSKIEVVYPAVNDVVADSVRMGGGVTYVGRIAWNKDVKDLVEALSRCPVDFPINIVTSSAYGSPPTDYCGTANHHVRWHIDIGDAEKFEIIRNSGVVVLPSRFEGYGMVPAEALYCGTKVVCYDLPVLREVYGDSIEYVPAGNMSEMVGKVVDIAVATEPNVANVHTMKSLVRDVRNLRHIPFKWRDESEIQFSFVMCVFNGVDWIDQVIESVYDEAHEIIVVEGAVDWWAEQCDADDGMSTDGTHEILMKWADLDDSKVKYYGPMRFHNKAPLRQFAVDQVDHANVVAGKCVYWILDADEAYTASGLAAMRRTVFENQGVKLFQPRMVSYWRDVFHNVTGSNWDMLHTKVIVWEVGDHYDTGVNRHNEPMDAVGRGLHISRDYYRPDNGHSLIVDECAMHHLGHALRNPDAQELKSDYYRHIDGSHFADRVRPGVTVHDYNGPWPEPIKRMIDSGELTR